MAINILAQLGLPFLVEIVSGVLRGVNHPSAQTTADALDDLQNTINTGGLSGEALGEANRHLEEMARLKIEEQTKLAGEVNKSLRAEIASNDPYVRRMRPTFGYLMALTWAAQMFGVAYIMIFNTREAILVIEAIESLGTIWAVALSVLGIYVYKRSDEKKAQSKFFYIEEEEHSAKIDRKIETDIKVKGEHIYNE
ncbi:MAG: ribokinase [Alphaproteobacteria bacterium]|nr:ribokinase [Alphaproteobacteria bacterium]|tara:strand:+ start:3804 stop:4391 length:588 start_codon:yes stop_codon:yes gene_type:complete